MSTRGRVLVSAYLQIPRSVPEILSLSSRLVPYPTAPVPTIFVWGECGGEKPETWDRSILRDERKILDDSPLNFTAHRQSLAEEDEPFACSKI
ncbi:hypothetical protein D9757_004966 [Collybiopsis confluens]|uniref:Uncharacterized protein n=1 Tax=Collybiopsis confluens TaxID=2823264 RepID=A0A8H5HTV3_9AGAR|nr:hypothetical protein D9757_004966 [Collybiopsis confluens]